MRYSEEKKQKGASRPEWVSELLLKKETLKHPCGGNAGQEDQTVSCYSLPYLQVRRTGVGGKSVNPISIKGEGADYAHHISTRT